MSKLLTPVLYDDSLGGLNSVRPLVIGDKVDNFIDMPVLDASPVGDNRSVRGKLLRCDNNGSLLESNYKGYENVEVIDISFSGTLDQQTFTFSQVVECVFYEYVSDVDLFDTRIQDPTYSIILFSISVGDNLFIPFRCKNIYIENRSISENAWTTSKLHGFY